MRTGRDDDGVEQLVADRVAQPAKMSDVAVGHGAGELHLDRHDAAVATLHDQVDLVLAGGGAQMTDAGLRGLGVHPHAERHERLEEDSEGTIMTVSM
jgi:hypothetical protein